MKKITFSILLLLMLWGLLALTMRLIWGTDQTTDEISNWSAYYDRTVKSYMTIPEEAIILKAIHTHAAIRGERFLIEFRLLTENTPTEWLDQIQEASRIKASWRRSEYLIDCQRECDLWRVEYLAERDLYVARGGWD